MVHYTPEGAEVKATDNEGNMALDHWRNSPYVLPQKRKAVEKLLLAHGAKTSAELDAPTAQPAPAPAQPEPGQ